MTLEEAKIQYPNEWIAFVILKSGDNPEGEVEYHNNDPEEFDQEVLKRKLNNVYLTYTGEITPEEGVLIL